ncbi:MAG: outer membrane protein assembly factor BamA, partial [Micavibrio aeruginosavorus]
MRQYFRYLFSTAAIILTAVPASWAATVREIRVTGTERIEPATVMSYLELKQGDDASQEALDSALKGLFATGLFADVTLSESNGVVTVNVAENPVINVIAFEGNDEIKDEELQAEIQLRSRQVFTRTKVQEDVARLYEIYRRKGQYSAEIEPKVIKLDQNRVNLVFEISEGPVTDISTIRFVGNERFSDDELRSEMTSQEARWYNFLTTADRYDPDRLSFDQEKLRQFYLKEGYADFRILSAVSELSQDKKNFFITMTVDEGERYKVNDIRINSQIRNLDPASLTDQATFKVKDWYNAEEVKNSVDLMTKKLGDMQYAFVTVVPDVVRNRDQKMVDIVFNINESPRVFVERVDINGNVRTLDKVVRRQMELVEGDPFNPREIRRAAERIRALGFFSDAEVTTEPGSSEDQVLVNVDVTEQPTGSLTLGATYSVSDGIALIIGFQETNFLGRGQTVGLNITGGTDNAAGTASFFEPAFLGRDLGLRLSVYYRESNYQNSFYDTNIAGFRSGLIFPVGEYSRLELRYALGQEEITNVSDNSSVILKREEARGMLVDSVAGFG